MKVTFLHEAHCFFLRKTIPLDSEKNHEETLVIPEIWNSENH